MSQAPFPTDTIEGERAWIGADLLTEPERWRVQLGPEAIQELERAAEAFLSAGGAIGEIRRETFPLPSFSTHLVALRRKLVSGIGFEVISGLPVERYSREEAAAIFCGIGAHLGSARSQNAKGHILGHVCDQGRDGRDPKARIYQTAERQTFHTDSSDVVGLLCLQTARSGGDSLLVSAETLCNRIRQTHPHLLPLLFDPIATDRRGEVPEGEQPFMQIPPLSWHQGQLTVFYQRQYIDSAQHYDGVFPLTEAHIEALDLFDQLANDETLHLRMQLAPGDMQFVYNHGLLHDRTGFIDWPEPERRRHLLRLWLSIPGDRALPEVFKSRYGSIEIGQRGGIVTLGTRLHAPLSP